MFAKSVPITKERAGFSNLGSNSNIEKCGKSQFYGFILRFVNIFRFSALYCSERCPDAKRIFST